MKHISVTSKSMPAIAQGGGLATKSTVFPFFPRNDFSFWPFNFILGLTGITKRIV